MMEMSMIKASIKENDAYTEVVENQLKSKSSKQSSMVKTEEEDDIYKQFYIDNNNVIGPS